MIKVYLVLSDNNFGGAGRVNLIFVESCDMTQFDITVLIPKNSVLKQKLEALNAKVIETKYGADKSLDFNAVCEFYRIFKADKPDIVHTHASMSARIAARLVRNIKVIATRHSVFSVSKSYPKRLGGFVNNSTADRFIAVSESAKDNLLKLGVKSEKIDVGVNGTKPIKQIDKVAAKAKMGFAGKFVVSIVGRLEAVKGHEYFLQAAKLLEDEEILFVIAGTGTLEDKLKSEAGKNVIFTGHLDDVTTLISATDIIANCSYGTEATSMALIEAMSIGVPAVVSDYGGNPYVVKNGVSGFVVPKQNSKAFVEKVLLLARNESLYTEMSKCARYNYKTSFSAEKMVRETENVYKKVLFRRK